MQFLSNQQQSLFTLSATRSQAKPTRRRIVLSTTPSRRFHDFPPALQQVSHNRRIIRSLFEIGGTGIMMAVFLAVAFFA